MKSYRNPVENSADNRAKTSAGSSLENPACIFTFFTGNPARNSVENSAENGSENGSKNSIKILQEVGIFA